MAGSSTVLTAHDVEGSVKRFHVTATGDDTDGTMPTLALPSISGKLILLVTNPGVTGPTASYDITLVDAAGVDRLQGVGADRHTSNTEQVGIFFSGTSLHVPVVYSDVLTLTIANTSVNDATTEIYIYYEGTA